MKYLDIAKFSKNAMSVIHIPLPVLDESDI